MQKKYRFFYHYVKNKQAMSVHFRNECVQVDAIVCTVPCNTKWNKKQPKLVMQGFASSVQIKNKVAFID